MLLLSKSDPLALGSDLVRGKMKLISFLITKRDPLALGSDLVRGKMKLTSLLFSKHDPLALGSRLVERGIFHGGKAAAKNGFEC